jgi:hypothetical protein
VDNDNADDTAALIKRVEELEARLTQLTHVPPSGGKATTDRSAARTITSRRGLFKLAGTAAVGGAAASLLAASPASATDGNGILMGDQNVEEAPTWLHYDGTSSIGSTDLFTVYDSTGPLNNSSFPSALAGWAVAGAAAVANGVYGYTSVSDGYGSIGFGDHDTSTHGVLASSTAGYGLVAQGGLAPIRIEPAGTAGAPTSGAHAVGELYVDSSGVLYQCITAGSPGTWAQSLLLDQTNTATGTTSVTSTGGAALQGTITGNGTGVAGSDTSTTAGGVGVQGVSTKGYGLVAGGGRAPLRLLPASTAGAPTSASDPHLLGEVYVDSGGVIYQCVAAGTPGTWLRMAAGPVGYAQGALCLLSTPIRVFDSRLRDTPAAPSRAAGPVKGRTTQTLQITGATVAGVSVPAGAVGVVGNLTVVSPTVAGYLTCYPVGVTRPGTPSIDFARGATVANAVTVRLSPSGRLQIYADVTTQVIFDASGFIA